MMETSLVQPMDVSTQPPTYSPPAERQQFKKPALLTPSTMCSSEGSEASTGGSVATAPSAPYLTTSSPQHMNTTPRNSSCSSSASSNNLTGNRRSIRLSLPSPSRPRLDPQYAARLANQQRPYGILSATASSASPTGLVPPPGITRDSDESIFRPTPIVYSTTSTSTNKGDCAQKQTQLKFQQCQHPTHVSNSPSSNYFFQSTSPTYSDRSLRRMSSSSLGYAASSPSSTRSYSRRSSSSSLSDVGTSDRFIASRATSNFSVNLWDGISSRRRPSPSSSAGRNTNSYNQHQSHNSNASNMHNTNGVPDDTSGVNGATGQTNNADGADPATADGSTNPNGRSNDGNSSSQPNLLNVLLRSELLGENLNPYASSQQNQQQQQNANAPGASRTAEVEPLREGGNYLHFQSPRQLYQANVLDDATSIGPTSVVNNFSLTPVRSAASQRLMAAPQKRKRRISKVPFKVLDAPALQDDFYLNLVDWSSQNVLAVGLGSCVYLWSACTSKVTKLCDLAQTEDIVTSVSWAQRGTHLAVGTNRGEVLLWDTIKCKKVRTMAGHSARVGTLAWSGPILASGSRDRLIYLRDVRVQASFTDRLAAHKQEVCGLKWSFDEPSFLASGGNDNQLHVVDSRNPTQPVQRFSDHTAAVKAIAWSPHQHGLLASGGGTADRCIRFWNTLSGTSLSCVDTGSQVCNLAWSQNCNEIVSTHGYSLNQIVVWRYPSMSKVVTLTGHTYRVLYLAMSPDGSTIVTGAGDETLRFWQVFPGPRSDSKNSSGGLLFPNTLGSVIR